MDVCWSVSRMTQLSIAAGLAMVLPLSGLAIDRTYGEPLTVTVFPDRFMAFEAPFGNLGALDALVEAMSPSVVRLDGCGTASANAILVAAERYRGKYLEIRMLAESERSCGAIGTENAVRVSQPGRTVPVRVGYIPDAEYWQSVMP